ncbi:MAG: hypothetical protein V2J26_06495 [Pacificimonas sp.]|nr:hypothetical protein [Pacificimonas sp.]
MPPAQPPFVMTILRSAGESWWRDFAPITILGLLLLTGTELAVYATGGSASSDPNTQTLVQTAKAAAFSLFVAAVSAGHLLRLSEPSPAPKTYVLGGLRLAQPGLLTALTIAAVLFGLLIIDLILRALLGGWSSLFVFALSLFVIALWLPAIPAAIAERLPPLTAMKRGANLTKGMRGRLTGLVLFAAALLIPPFMAIYAVVYGVTAVPSDEGALSALPALTPATARFWIVELSDVIFGGLIASIPPAVYLALRTSPPR